MYLPKPPLQSVTSVTYWDVDGTQQTWDSSKYHVVAPTKAQGWIEPIATEVFPSVDSRPDAITIRFVCGYTTQPGQVVHLVKMLVAGWNEVRESENSFTGLQESKAIARLMNQLKSGVYI